MDKALKHLMRAPVTVTENMVRFSEGAIDTQISGLDQLFPQDTSSEKYLRFKRKAALEMRGAQQQLKSPKQGFLSTPPELTKHFMMVSISNFPASLPPKQYLDYYAKIEAIKRFLQQSGAEVTVVNSTQENIPRRVFCRDPFIRVSDVILLPDQEDEIEMANYLQSNLRMERFLKNTHGSFIEREERIAEVSRLDDFLKDQGEEVIILSEMSFDGGDVITDPRTKSIFIGLDGEEDEDFIETIQRVIHRNVAGGWTVYPVPLKDVTRIDPHG